MFLPPCHSVVDGLRLTLMARLSCWASQSAMKTRRLGRGKANDATLPRLDKMCFQVAGWFCQKSRKRPFNDSKWWQIHSWDHSDVMSKWYDAQVNGCFMQKYLWSVQSSEPSQSSKDACKKVCMRLAFSVPWSCTIKVWNFWWLMKLLGFVVAWMSRR